MLPKFRSVNVPNLGHASLEFTFALYAYLFHAMWWVGDALRYFLEKLFANSENDEFR